MNYRHIYMCIIAHAKSEEKLGLRKKGNGEYYERHHILPKSLFPLWTKEKRNLVLLTFRALLLSSTFNKDLSIKRNVFSFMDAFYNKKR